MVYIFQKHETQFHMNTSKFYSQIPNGVIVEFFININRPTDLIKPKLYE